MAFLLSSYLGYYETDGQTNGIAMLPRWRAALYGHTERRAISLRQQSMLRSCNHPVIAEEADIILYMPLE